MTKEDEAKILAMVDAQTKYSTKEELLKAVRDYLTNNLFKEDKKGKRR